MTPNQLKLFVVQNNQVLCKLVEIPTNLSTNECIEDIKSKLPVSDLRYILFIEPNGNCFFYNFEENLSEPLAIYGIDVERIPSATLIKIAKNSDLFINSDKPTTMDFVESDLFQGFSELKTMQIHNETDVRTFIGFVINTLDINFHPDDPFENFFEAGETKTFQGIVCVITQEDLDFLNATVEDCAAIVGDAIYDIAFEILSGRMGFGIGVGGTEYFDGSNYEENRLSK